MKPSTIKLTLGLFCLALLLALPSCETNDIASPASQDINLAQSEGLPASEINWVSYKPEVVSQICTKSPLNSKLARRGSEFKLIEAHKGGTVGGGDTYDNIVEIPPFAIPEDKWFAVALSMVEYDDFIKNLDNYEIEELLNVVEENLHILQGVEDDGALDKVNKALEKLPEVKIYCTVYSMLTESKPFDRLKSDISDNMKEIAKGIAKGNIGRNYLENVIAVGENATKIARIIAITTIHYAESIDNPDLDNIEKAYEEMAEGDLNAQIPDEEVYYKFKDAIDKYKKAWENAMKAIPEINNAGAAADFLPSTQFLMNVKVTLSWEALDFDGDPENLNIYWYNEANGLWVLVPDPEFDFDHQTISIYIDHFTRYAWGWGF